MNILFDINHPAHVHYFRNTIQILKKLGHNVIITSRDKDVTLRLLDGYKLQHIPLSKAKKNLLGLGLELLLRQSKLFLMLIKNKISVCISSTGACSVYACKALGIPSLVFYDTEDAHLQNNLSIPLATQFITPSSYQANGGKRHLTYNGVQELAYLHPKYFHPDSEIFDLLRIQKDEKYIVLRFVAWNAAHDIGKRGFSLEQKLKIVNALSKYAKILIVSESPLNKDLRKYSYNISPEKIHDLLNFATLYIGESATMASESACLGTPAIYFSPRKLGYVKEGERYGLIFDIEDVEAVIQKAKEIISQNDQSSWQQKGKQFVADHIDVTEFFVDTILTYDKR